MVVVSHWSDSCAVRRLRNRYRGGPPHSPSRLALGTGQADRLQGTFQLRNPHETKIYHWLHDISRIFIGFVTAAAVRVTALSRHSALSQRAAILPVKGPASEAVS